MMTAKLLKVGSWKQKILPPQAGSDEATQAVAGAIQKTYLQDHGSFNKQYNADTIVINNIHKGQQASPLPGALLPYRRDPDFIRRPELLQILPRVQSSSISAIVGFGGVGKTQLVLETCYQVREEQPATWIFWIHASSAVRFNEDVRTIVQHIQARDAETHEESDLDALSRWLSDGRNGKWLLVLDNADEVDFLMSSEGRSSSRSVPSKPRWEHLSRCTRGSILITSRNESSMAQLMDECDIIKLEPDQDLAIALLQRKLKHTETAETVEELACALDYVPLALTQAAAFMNRRGSRCTASMYLAKLHSADEHVAKLLSNTFPNTRRDLREAKNSILAAWSISFDHILQIRPGAADALSLMSHYDFNAIPIALLGKQDEPTWPLDDHSTGSSLGCSQLDEALDMIIDNAELEEDIAVLRDFSFVQYNADASTVSMHALVQLATRSWLIERGTHTKWLIESMRRIDLAFPESEHRLWSRCQPIYAHAKLHMSTSSEDEQVQRLRASLLHKSARYAVQQKYYKEAEGLAEEAYIAAVHVFGTKSKAAVDCLADLAAAKRQQEKHDEADRLTEQVLFETRDVLGPEHPSTLVSMSNQAVVLVRRGKFDEAETLLRQTIDVKNRVLEPQHPATMVTMTNLAHVLAKTGRSDEAERMFWQAIDGLSEHVSNDDPTMLKCMMPLASFYEEQERYADAEVLYSWVYNTRRRVLGELHLDTIAAELELGVLRLHMSGDADVQCYYSKPSPAAPALKAAHSFELV